MQIKAYSGSSGFLLLSSLSTFVHIAVNFAMFSYWSDFPEGCSGYRHGRITLLFGALCSVFSAFLIAQIALVVYHYGVNYIPRDFISVSAIVTSLSSAIITGAALATVLLLHSKPGEECSSAPISQIMILLSILIMIDILLTVYFLYHFKHQQYNYSSWI